MHDRAAGDPRTLTEPLPEAPAARRGARTTIAGGARVLLRSQSRNIGMLTALAIGVAIVSIPNPA